MKLAQLKPTKLAQTSLPTRLLPLKADPLENSESLNFGKDFEYIHAFYVRSVLQKITAHSVSL